jgi:hypothetical protein
VSSPERTSLNPSESQPSSPEGSLANPIQLRENVKVLVMSVTSGLSCGESFAKLNPDGSWVKTSRGSVQVTLDGSLEEFTGTWPKWGILSGGVAGKLPMLELPTIESDCSLLRTPNVMDSLEPKSQTALDHEAISARPGRSEPNNLRDQLAVRSGEREWKGMLPTPSASDYMGGIPPNDGKYRIQEDGTQWGLKLNQRIAMLRTPGTKDPGISPERLQTKEGGPAKIGERAYDRITGRHAQVGLTQQIAMLPTPRSAEAGNYQYAAGDHEKPTLTLSGAIAMLPTPGCPRPHDTEKTAGVYFPSQNQRDLTQVIALIPTPKSRDYKGETQRGPTAPEDGLQNTLSAASGITKQNRGERTGLKLQPAFVEWMMGFPQGWTALNASEMLSSRNKSIRSSKQSQTLKEGGEEGDCIHTNEKKDKCVLFPVDCKEPTVLLRLRLGVAFD